MNTPLDEVNAPSIQIELNLCRHLHHYLCMFGDRCRLPHHLPWRLWFQVWKLVCSWWSALMPVFYTFHLFLTDHFGSWNSMSVINLLVRWRSYPPSNLRWRCWRHLLQFPLARNVRCVIPNLQKAKKKSFDLIFKGMWRKKVFERDTFSPRFWLGSYNVLNLIL